MCLCAVKSLNNTVHLLPASRPRVSSPAGPGGCSFAESWLFRGQQLCRFDICARVIWLPGLMKLVHTPQVGLATAGSTGGICCRERCTAVFQAFLLNGLPHRCLSAALSKYQPFPN